MTAEISDRVREIADARGVPESEVFEQTLELGIADLWENVVLGKYGMVSYLVKRRSNWLDSKTFSEPIAKQQPLMGMPIGLVALA